MAELLGNPQDDFKVIHIAGTNGKGSVALKVARGLQKMGFRTGLFTSPHVNSFRERISVDGELISQKSVIELCDEIMGKI